MRIASPDGAAAVLGGGCRSLDMREFVGVLRRGRKWSLAP
jgi:hypothetical protein